MSLYSSLDIASSGMTAQRLRMDLVASNIANASTTRTEQGGPFRRRLAIFATRTITPPRTGYAPGQDWGKDLMPYQGVRVVGIGEDQRPFEIVYDPGHPDADEFGNVAYPNVDTITEMVDLIESNRAYEANMSVFETAKSLLMRTLTMGR